MGVDNTAQPCQPAAMLTNTKGNEHPRCGCRMCRYGAARAFGQFVHRKVNRKIRHAYRMALAKLVDGDTPRIVVSTGYTD